MGHQNIQTQSPMATIISVTLSFLYGVFVVTNKIFVNSLDFIEAAVRVIIISLIGFVATKIWEFLYKKYIKK